MAPTFLWPPLCSFLPALSAGSRTAVVGAVNVRQLVLVLVPVRATERFLWPQAASQDPEDVVERNATQAQGGSAAKPEDWAAVSRCQ